MADRGVPKKRRGRPPIRKYKARPGQRLVVPLSTRIPPTMKALLEEMAALNGWPLSREIEENLRRSMNDGDPAEEPHRLGKALMANMGLHGCAVAISFVLTTNLVRRLVWEFVSSERGKPWTTDRWLSDPRCWAAFKDAVTHLNGDEGTSAPGPKPKPGEWDRIGPWAAATVRAELQGGLPKAFWRPVRKNRHKVDMRSADRSKSQ